MVKRAKQNLGLWPERLAADTTYGSAEMLQWLVHEQGIEPHIPVFGKSRREHGTFSRHDFTYDPKADAYTCPAGKLLKHSRRAFKVPRTGAPKDDTIRDRASTHDCSGCALKPKCCPGQPHRKVPRSIFEGARDMAREIANTGAYATSRRQRKKVELSVFAHRPDRKVDFINTIHLLRT